MEAKLILEKLEQIKSKHAIIIYNHVFNVWLFFVSSEKEDMFNGIYDLLIKTQKKYRNDTTKMRLKNDQKHT